jgi:hypothetical protein
MSKNLYAVTVADRTTRETSVFSVHATSGERAAFTVMAATVGMNFVFVSCEGIY